MGSGRAFYHPFIMHSRPATPHYPSSTQPASPAPVLLLGDHDTTELLAKRYKQIANNQGNRYCRQHPLPWHKTNTTAARQPTAPVAKGVPSMAGSPRIAINKVATQQQYQTHSFAHRAAAKLPAVAVTSSLHNATEPSPSEMQVCMEPDCNRNCIVALSIHLPLPAFHPSCHQGIWHTNPALSHILGEAPIFLAGGRNGESHHHA